MDKNEKFDEMMDDIQKGNNFSFFVSEVRGEKLSPEQEAAKVRTRDMLEHLDDSNIDKEVSEILNRK